VAGKLRRYNHLTIWQQLTWPSLVLKNLRDGLLVVVGVIQSIFKLFVWRPDVVFTKGGFVCLPVGFAAHLLRIPLVIHDSDAHPGLTNRVLSRWATTIATGAPLEFYHYDPQRAYYVGIPINQQFHPYTSEERLEAKRHWKLDETQPLLVVTGGGLGAMRLNNVVIRTLSQLLERVSVVLLSGVGQYEELRTHVPEDSEHFQLKPFVTDMPSLLGAADIVVSRAGATTILELAALQKPTILVPNAKLTGGHQLKNAAVYAADDAVIVLNEDEMEAEPERLVQAVGNLLDQPDRSAAMAERFLHFSRPQAAQEMARLIIAAVPERNR